jgi:hypothetical protein
MELIEGVDFLTPTRLLEPLVLGAAAQDLASFVVRKIAR